MADLQAHKAMHTELVDRLFTVHDSYVVYGATEDGVLKNKRQKQNNSILLNKSALFYTIA